MRGLPGHEFAVYALGRNERAGTAGLPALPPQVRDVRVLPLWGPPPGPGGVPGKARRRRAQALEQYRDLVGVLAGDAGANGVADRFASALYGLAELAREDGGVPALLRSEHAVRVLEEVCRAPGARPLVGEAGVGDLLLAADQLERALRPLAAPWYDEFGDALATADLCHAVTGGTALLPALLAKRFFGTPLLVTEYGVRLRETLLLHRAAGLSAPVRALLAAFHRHLAGGRTAGPPWSPPATPTRAAGRSTAAPSGTACVRSTPATRGPCPSPRPTPRAASRRWCGSAGSTPARTW